MNLATMAYWYGMALYRDLTLLQGMLDIVHKDLKDGGVL